MFISFPDPPLAPRDPNRICRTLPVEAVAAPIAPTSSKSNPFGDAKPITDEERERRMQAAKVKRARLMTSQQFIPKPTQSTACPPSLCISPAILNPVSRLSARSSPPLPPLPPKSVAPPQPGRTDPDQRRKEEPFRAEGMVAGAQDPALSRNVPLYDSMSFSSV